MGQLRWVQGTRPPANQADSSCSRRCLLRPSSWSKILISLNDWFIARQCSSSAAFPWDVERFLWCRSLSDGMIDGGIERCGGLRRVKVRV